MRGARRLLLIGMDTYFGREIVKGIHSYCRSHGHWEYHLARDSAAGLKMAKTTIQEWKPDGIITIIHNLACERLVKNSRLPCINLSGSRGFSLPTVFADDIAAGKMAARYLMDIGFRNFAFSSITPSLYTRKRCEGFVGELSKAGFGCDVFTDQFISPTHDDWPTNHRRIGPWLRSLKKPVALMAMHDPRGEELASVCQHLGLRVPDDVAIVAVGNTDLHCQMCNPPLSSVDIDHARIGYESSRLMDRMIHGAKPPSQLTLIPPRRLVVRQSSDIIAMDDPDIAATLRLIRDHAHLPISVKDLLQKIPISRKTMERRFEKFLGRSPTAEITRVHIERAKDLLVETDLLVPAVARESGFTGRVIFGTIFRRHTGLTPMQYRRKSRVDSGIRRH